MNTVSFSSWNGKIVDNRNGQVPASKLAEVKFPEKLDGQEPAAVMGWDGIVVRDAQADILSLTLAYLREARKLSCGECSVCMIGIDKVIGIMKAMMEGQGSAESVEEIEEIAVGVAANSKCNYGRTAALVPVLDAVRYFRDDFLALANGEKKASEKAYSTAVTAPCIEACPAKLDIPGYIELIRNNRFGDSLDLIRKRCILPGVLGRACTHPCESACVRNDIDETLAIRLLKRAAADYGLARDGNALGNPAAEREGKVAIVGAGPAGLAAAYHLRLMGYQVTIFEALPVAGGMAMVGIPAYRLPRNILNHEVELIEKMGVDIRLNSRVTQLDWDGLQQQGYRALFLAVGAHVGTRVGCSGEDAGSEDFVQGAEFLRKIALGGKVQPRNKVVIIGGGNVALDCARSCLRLGFKDVEILYRRSRKEMPARQEEIREAEEEGVKFNFLKAPVSVIMREGKVVEVECIKMRLGEPDESGRRRPVEIPGSEFVMKTDMVIAATGQAPDLKLLEKNAINVTNWGTIQVDPVGYGTNIPGIFAGGDCVTGPATLIEALDAGNKVARSMDAFIQDRDFRKEFEFNDINTGEQRDIGFVPVTPARKPVFLEVSKRLNNFDEVEGGFSAAEAIDEARRCLRCYRLLVWE